MTKIKHFVARFRRDEDGAAMVEYGIALLVVASIGIAAFTIIGDQVALNVEAACNVIKGATTAGCAPQ